MTPWWERVWRSLSQGQQQLLIARVMLAQSTYSASGRGATSSIDRAQFQRHLTQWTVELHWLLPTGSLPSKAPLHSCSQGRLNSWARNSRWALWPEAVYISSESGFGGVLKPRKESHSSYAVGCSKQPTVLLRILLVHKGFSRGVFEYAGVARWTGFEPAEPWPQSSASCATTVCTIR